MRRDLQRWILVTLSTKVIRSFGEWGKIKKRKMIKILRELSRLEWLKVACPKCEEEMTLYLTPQEMVEEAQAKGAFLETVCSYCQNRIRLDARTFEPRL